MSDGTDDLVVVQLVGLPVGLYRHAAEHQDELLREFALLQRSDPDESSVPARLRRLSEELQARFGSFTSQPSDALREAVVRGDERIDLTYRVPSMAKQAALELDALLDEADAFCLTGEHLLTLTTPAGPRAFRRWFLAEFVAQAEGTDPTSWDEYAARASIA